ncbi:Uncharacterised protein [Halioglobus japonicus]|nr:Uncharacterised protein [Halioglobus japonicus]
MDEISIPQRPRRRRRHSGEFKARIVAACREPGASVASVALQHGLNANLVRRWIKVTSPTSAFVPLALPAPPKGTLPTLADDTIRIEVPRTGGTVSITWPANQADRAVALLR